MRNRRRRGRHINMISELSMTPMIDTAFALLIIFMVTAPIMQNAIKVALPKGKVQESKGEQEDLVVYIDKEGTLFLNTIPLSQEKIIAELVKIAMQQKDKTIFVKADTGVAYGTVIRLVDRIKMIQGIEYVALATERV